jgi:hypothetical protein
MRRRFIVIGLAAALAAPALAVTPASAFVIFTCTSASGTAFIAPGLSHTPAPQHHGAPAGISLGSCSNLQTGSMEVGAGGPSSLNAVATFPPRPLGCPTALGGAGPDYPNQTPIFFGADPSFKVVWSSGPNSTGIAKVKSAGPSAPTTLKIVFVVTAGQYAPPAGKKTKIKASLDIAPIDTFNCVNDSDPISSVSVMLSPSTSLIVQQV